MSCTANPQAPKNDRQPHGDIVPPIPFFMRPTHIALYFRHKLGTAALLRAARSPVVVLKTQGIEKPTGIGEPCCMFEISLAYDKPFYLP